jgi:precorrin-2 dehydrogenase/sirohydrochlorin ferrochelatase
MLPLVLNPHSIKVGLAGQGEALARRAALLAEAGVEARLLSADVSDAVLQPLQLLFVAGLTEDEARHLAGRARGLGLLVNVEDAPPLCDFHVPAIVRRGELLLTASTGGAVPGLARRLREWLADTFGPEWTERLSDLSAARARWRSAGLSTADVSQKVRDLIDEKGWL